MESPIKFIRRGGLLVTNLVMAYFITKFKKSPQGSNLSGMIGIAF
jgi:hypothetical protein